MNILSTIGYEASSMEDFRETLLVANIKTLIDVRQVAISRRKGFSKKALRSAVEEAGITYVHLAGLGDPKEGREAAKAGQFDKFLKIYTTHMKTDEFRSDLREVLQFVNNEDICLMCYERDYKKCHRKLISEEVLTMFDVKVRHLGVRQGIAKNGPSIWSRARPDFSEGVAARR